MKKSEGLQDSQVFEFIRKGDDRGSQFSDQRGVRILEKLIRQDPKNREGLEKAHEYLMGDPNYTSAMHAAALSMREKKIKVFISYRFNSDADATRAIAKVLGTLSDRIEVTSADDFPSRIAGQDYREEIQRMISQAHWFVVLLSDPRRTSEWSMYETGMFRAGMVSKRMNRLICIHHPRAKPPDQIYEYQAVSANLEQMVQFLQGVFCEPNPLPGWNALRLDVGQDVLEASAKKIVDAFKAPSKPFKFNRWIKLEVASSCSLQSWKDLAPCSVETDVRTLELFGKSQPPATWGALIENVLKQNDTGKWLEELHAVIVKAISGNAFRPITGTFESSYGGRVMRPILHSMETDGRGEVFHFNLYFIDEISTAPVRALPSRLRMLLSVLRMSERIRWEVLERFRDAEWAHEQVAVCTIAFSRIEREGQLFGEWELEELCANYDESTRDEVRRIVDRWRALKGYRPGPGALRAGDLDVAFEQFDRERIKELMAECQDLINRFLYLTYPVLEKIMRD